MGASKLLHSRSGVNIQNFKSLTANTQNARPSSAPAYRSSQEPRRSMGGDKSPRLRNATVHLQASDTLMSRSVDGVNQALLSKLTSLQQQRDGLRETAVVLGKELDRLGRCQKQLHSAKQHLAQLVALNHTRQGVRAQRPVCEPKHDSVARDLALQHELLEGLCTKVVRALALVDTSHERMRACKQHLHKSLTETEAAIERDNAVLAVPLEYTFSSSTPAVPSGSTSHVRWEGVAQERLSAALTWIQEAARLRKAVKQLLVDARASLSSNYEGLDTSMAERVVATHEVADKLRSQLLAVETELAGCFQHREGLRQSMQEQRWPLRQLHERASLRARPSGSSGFCPDDEVDAALAAQTRQLAAANNDMVTQEAAINGYITHLSNIAEELRRHLKDSETSASLEERCLTLAAAGARSTAGTDAQCAPPGTPSVASMSNACSASYSQAGDSASQVAGAASSAGPTRPSSAKGGRTRPKSAAHGGVAGSWQGRPAGGSVVGGSVAGMSVAGGSAAGGSATADGSATARSMVSSAAAARIGLLEEQLMAARTQTAQMEEAIAQLKQQHSPKRKQVQAHEVSWSMCGSKLGLSVRPVQQAAVFKCGAAATLSPAAKALAASRPMTASAAERLARNMLSVQVQA